MKTANKDRLFSERWLKIWKLIKTYLLEWLQWSHLERDDQKWQWVYTGNVIIEEDTDDSGPAECNDNSI